MSFTEMYDAMAPFIRRVAQRFSPRCKDTQNELEQLGLVTCWRLLEQYPGRTAEDLTKIARSSVFHAAVSYVRAEKKHRNLQLEHFSGDAAVADRVLTRIATSDFLNKIVTQLQARDQEVFNYLRQGFRSCDAAATLGRSRVEVARSMQRIRAVAEQQLDAATT